MYLQPGTAGVVYWAIVLAATSLAVLVMHQSLAGSDEAVSPIEDTKEDQGLKQAA